MKNNLLILNIIFGVLLGIGLFYFLYNEATDNTIRYTETQPKESINGQQKPYDFTSSTKQEGANHTKVDVNTLDSNILVVDNAVMHKATDNPQNNIENQSGEAISKTTNEQHELEKRKKALLEITLLDGNNHQALAGLPVELRVQYQNGYVNQTTVTSNKEGKAYLSISSMGYASLFVRAKTYSIYSTILTLKNTNNTHVAQLMKSNTLEIRARTTDNSAIQTLNARFNLNPTRQQQHQYLSLHQHRYETSLEYDPSRGVYILQGLAEGLHRISFQTDGYFETNDYQLSITNDKTNELEILLHPRRKIFFDLNIADKPKTIYLFENQTFIRNTTRIEESLNRGYQTKKSRMPFLSDMFTQSKLRALYHTESGATQAQRDQQVLLSKNKKDLYEYELTHHDIVSVLLYADAYAPTEVSLNPNQDFYPIDLKPSLSGSLYLQNEKGEPVAKAIVNYSAVGVIPLTTTTSNERGLALIEGLVEAVKVHINILHKDYRMVNLQWTLDRNHDTAKTITLVSGQKIHGKVLFENQPVLGADVFLYQTDRLMYVDEVKTNSNGEYSFESLGNSENKAYMIKAFHEEFGSATTEPILLEKSMENFNLELKAEVCASLQLLDPQKRPLGKTNFILVATSIFQSFATQYTTDEKGISEIRNLQHGQYLIALDEASPYKIKNEIITIPQKTIILETEDKDLRKLNISLASGERFDGIVNIEIQGALSRSVAFNPIKNEKGDLYLELPDKMGAHNIQAIIIKAHTFAPVAFGPFKTIPKEFNVQLQEGYKLSLTIIDQQKKAILAGINAQTFTENGVLIQALPTNARGEVLFSNLPRKVHIVASHPGYCTSDVIIDLKEIRNFEMQLQRGGGLKGKFNKASHHKKVLSTNITLFPLQQVAKLNAKNEFEYFNLPAGEYQLKIYIILQDGKRVAEEISNLIIEEEKNLEINLDNLINF